MKRKLILIVTVVLTTLTIWSLRAGVNPHIVEVDLDIDYLAADDPTERTPGGFVCVEGRRKITLQKVQPADWGTTAGDSTKRVRLSWGSTKIAIYDAATGGNAVISGTDYANANLPTNFWVEGVAVSATAGTSSTPGPETILAQAIPDGMYDRISFTVYQVDSITVTPKNAPVGWTPPEPVTIGAGAIHSPAHQADVTIQVLPTVAGIPIDVSLSGGLSYQPGKAAELVMGTQAATGGCAVVTVLTGTNGTISGELTSSDVNNMECWIHASATETNVVFTWDEYFEQDEWTFEPGYLPVPGVLTNHLVLRHHRDGKFPATTNGLPWQPLNGHDIRFFVEKVEYWDADGNLCETNNTATAPADVSAWATFPTNPVTTDANGRVTELLTIVTNANLCSVTLVAYDTSVYRKAATPPPAPFSMLSLLGGTGTPKTLAAPVAPPERTTWNSLINGDSAYKVKFSKALEEDASGNQYGYDDMDTPINQTDDHVSVDEDNGVTFVLVTVVSSDGADGSDFTFTANPPNIVDIGPLPTPAPAAGFKLKIIGKPLGNTINKLETIIEARKIGKAGEPICGTIKVNVYRKKTTPNWIIYKVTDPYSPKTKPLFDIKGDPTKSSANKILKQAVMAVDYVDVEDRDNVPYDRNLNGCLEWYMDGAPGQPEFDIIKTAIGVHDANYKSVVVKKVNFAWRLSDKAPKDQKKITLKGVGSNQALIEYFNLKIADFRWVELGTGGKWELYKIDAIGTPKPDKTVDVWFETPLKQAYDAGDDMISAGWGGGTTDANPTIVSDFKNAEQATSILVHEALHRPTIGDLRDVKDQKNVMSFGDSPTELRFKEQLWTSHNLTFPQNQWDKIPRP